MRAETARTSAGPQRHAPEPPHRVLVIAPTARPLGGGEAVIAWALQAMQDIHRVTMLTWEPCDFAAINRIYGTTLSDSAISVLCAPRVLRRLFAPAPSPWSLYRSIALWRVAHLIGRRYNAVLHLNGEANLGRPGIQYINYPSLAAELSKMNGNGRYSLRDILSRKVGLWIVASGIRLENVRANVTFTNSQWTASVCEQAYGVRPQVIYPPAQTLSAGLPWAARQSRFLCCGRWGPEKRYEIIIDIIAALRARGHDVGLTIVALPFNPSYRKMILARCAAAGAWVEVHENLDRSALDEIIGRHRYGIHGNSEEHFGIAPAEMASSGCIIFVPDGGGQVEIVGEEQALLWSTPAEAIEKIDVVLRNAELQQSLRVALTARAKRFSRDRFMSEVRAAVADFVASR